MNLLSQRFLLLGTKALAASVTPSGQGKAFATKTTQNQKLLRPHLVSQQGFADTIYVGEVVTVNDAQLTAEAVAIKDGKILAVGSRDQVMEFQGDATQIIDLDGKTMVPGFFDAHGHMFQVGVMSAVANLSPPPDGEVDSITQLIEKLRQQISEPSTQALGWVIGIGYDDPLLAEQRHPTCDELDRVSTELPVLAIHSSGHLATVNSKALEIVDYTADTPDPAGGVIRRKPGTTEPSGVLEEFAYAAVLTKLGTPSPEQILAVLNRSCEIYASYGFTTAQEGRATRGILEALQYAATQETLMIDVNVFPDYVAVSDAHALDWPQQDYRNRLRLAGVKLTIDGSPQGKTAWLTQPYHIPPAGQTPDYKGYSAINEAVLYERVAATFANNVQLLTHCNGDAALDLYIKAIRSAIQKYGKADRRPTVIHCQVVREDQLDAMKELDMFPAMFPAHTFYWGDFHRDSVLGPERAARISPTQSVLKRGMRFTSHHDAPVVQPNAIRILWSTVNRRTRTNQVLGEDQRVTPLEGLKSITLWAAYQHFEEDMKGSIEPGKLADFAIISANPLTVDPMTIRDIEVLETIKEGRTVYQKAA